MAGTKGHWDRPSGPRDGLSHPCPLSGPWQVTWHLDIYTECGPFLNPLRFAEVETEAQRSDLLEATQPARGRAGTGTSV